MGQRTRKYYSFCRLLGPPRRLDLTQIVIRTTKIAPPPKQFAGRQMDARSSAKTRACMRKIPRSARGRGRDARRDATSIGDHGREISGTTMRVFNIRFRKQSTRKSVSVVVSRISICNYRGRFSIPITKFERKIILKNIFLKLRVR